MTRRWTQLTVANMTRSTIVCRNARLATSLVDRMRGLLGREELDAGSGLLIDPCSGVHTWGMAFSLDILALDRADRVIGLWSFVSPGRIRGMSFRTSRMLELAAGALAPSGTCLGDQLRLEEHSAGLVDLNPVAALPSLSRFLPFGRRLSAESVNNGRHSCTRQGQT